MTKHLCVKCLLLALLCCTQTIYAQTNLYSVEDLVDQHYLNLPYVISPDGQKIAWIRSALVTNRASYQTYIFVTTLTNGATQAMSDGLYEESDVSWSPDGQWLSFLSPRDTGAQALWLTPATGGVPTAAITGVVDLTSYAWRDNQHIIFTAAALANTLSDESGDDTLVADAPETPINLFQVDLTGGSFSTLRTNSGVITALAVFSNQVAIEWKSRSYSWRYGTNNWAQYYIMELDGNSVVSETRIFANAVGSDGLFWSPEGSRLYLLKDVYDEPDCDLIKINAIIYRDIASQQEGLVPLDWTNNLYFYKEFGTTTNGFCTILANGVRPQLARYYETSGIWQRQMMTGEHQGNIFSFSLDQTGNRLVYEYSTATKSPQLYAAALSSNQIITPQLLTAAYLNPSFSNKAIAPAVILQFTGARGEPVEGLLYYPVNYQIGQKYPLVVNVHGGPYWAAYDSWIHVLAYNPLFSQKGAFNLAINYHGSSDYGLAWGASLKNGHYYDLPVADLLLAINELIAQGLVDSDRLATLGWSNGAILSFALIASNGNFKAVTAGAGCSEWVAEWAYAEAESSTTPYYFGGDPTAVPNNYFNMSPFYALTNINTPVTMYLCAEDENVLPASTWTTYRGLSIGTRAALRMLIFPGEGHVPMLRPHLLRKLNEDILWFDQFLFASNMPLNRAVTANLNAGGTTNWYQLATTSGSVYTLNMSNATAGVIARLFDRQNNVIGEISNTNQTWTANNGGWYYIGISGNTTGAYDIAVLKTAEPNRAMPWLDLLKDERQ